MTVHDLIGVLGGAGDDDGRAGRVLAAARGLAVDDLERLFSVALRTGVLDGASARGLLAALGQARAGCGQDGSPGAGGEEEAELRREIALLEGRLEDARPGREKVAGLIRTVRGLEAEVLSGREQAAALSAEFAAIESQLRRVGDIETEVGL